VRLVDDEQLVRRHDVSIREHVDREQAVVGDDDVGFAGPNPRRLGEAVHPVRAARRADALAGRHRHQPPGRVVDARIELVAVAGLGARGPVAQSLDLLADPAGLAEPAGAAAAGVEKRIVGLVGRAAFQPGQTQVVVATLEHSERGPAAQHRLDRVGESGQVVVHQLGLQGEGGGGDHHRPVHQQRRHQIRQRLAGAGAGLHQQVLTRLRGPRHGIGHPLLAGAFDAAGHRRDSGCQQGVDIGRPAVPRLSGRRDGGCGVHSSSPVTARRLPVPYDGSWVVHRLPCVVHRPGRFECSLVPAA
jgi:hypothetical protein